MKVDPTEVSKITLNITEHIIVTPPSSDEVEQPKNIEDNEERIRREREAIISPDESYRSLADEEENDTSQVKILEESLIQSPNEEVSDRPVSGVVYPGQVLEVTYVDESEQQTEPSTIDNEKKEEIDKKPISVDIKEVQVSAETTENETQMSPKIVEDETLAKDTAETSMQTIIQEFIESESQTNTDMPEKSVEKVPQEEQETQTDEMTSDLPTTSEQVEKQEASIQTIIVKTQEVLSQTENPKDTKDARDASEVIVTEIILKAIQPTSPRRSPAQSPPQSPTQKSFDETIPKVEDIVVDSRIVEITEEPSAPIADKSDKKSKKNKKQPKKQKSKDNKVDLQIETIVQEPEKIEKSNIAMTFAPKDVNVDVQVAIAQPTTSSSPENVVFQRLNNIMKIETQEPMANEEQQFALSYNLNNLINNSDQKGLEIYPWNDVNYMINANIENRQIQNSSDYIVEEPDDSDEAINDSLQKVDQYVNLLPEIVNSGDERMSQKTVIVITKVIVTCLEKIERRIYYTKQNKEKDPRAAENLEKLERTLDGLKENIEPMKNNGLKEEIGKCISSLQHHVKLDKEAQNSVDDEIQNYQHDLKRTDDNVRHLLMRTSSIEDKFEQISQSDEIPFEEKLSILENLDSACKENKKFAGRLIKLDNLSDNQENDIRNCFDRTKNAEHNIWIEKRKLMQIMNLSEEYVQTLDEFTQITLIADSMVDKNVVTNSLEQLHNEIQRHRKFFVNLNHCRNILESLEKNLDPETKFKHSELHQSLHQKATAILEKAGVRSQNLSLAASRWTHLDRRMQNEEQWLQVAEQRVPDLSSVTSADYEQYINLYQSLNADLAQHQSKMLQNIETAIGLQELICAPSLETRCNDSLTKLVKIREDVNQYLKMLLNFRQLWNEYNSNADKLEMWMNHIDNELNTIQIPKNFGEYPAESLRNFWEIKAQYEYNCQIHANVCDKFEKSLKTLSIADDRVQLQFYGQLEDRWRKVTNRIDGIKTQIVENFSSPSDAYADKLSFLERELDELVFSINNMKGIIRNPDELNMYIERLIVLKSRIVVVENELVTIGFVSANESEKVGELCEKSHKVSNAITEELELADLCKGCLNTLRQEIGDIRESQIGFYEKLLQFDSAAKLESASIEKAIYDCQLLRNDLVIHWKEIMRVRHLLHTLPTGLRMSVSPVDVEKEISQLEDDYVDIEKRLFNIENLLKSRLQLWKRFERQLEAIQQSIEETDFMVELLTVHGNIDYDRLQRATEKLEGLYCDFDSHEKAVHDLKDYAQPLLEFCEDNVSQDIENSMQKATVRWNETNDNLKHICDKYKKAVTLWRKYCDESEAIRNVINEHFGGVDNFLEDRSLDDIQVILHSTNFL
jgi:hypothetical protein